MKMRIKSSMARGILEGLDKIKMPDVMGILEKAKTHKYTVKEWKNDHWEYTYPETNNERRARIANQTELITDVKPLPVTESNVIQQTNNYFATIQQEINNGLKCIGLQNRRVIGIKKSHFFKTHGKQRPLDELIRRAALLPFVVPIIKTHGKLSHIKKNARTGKDYELVGRAEINGKKYAITVVLTDAGNDLLYISVFDVQNNMVKSLGRENGSFLHEGPIATVAKLTSPQSHILNIPDISAKSIRE